MMPSGIWNRDRVRVKSVIMSLVRRWRILAWRSIHSKAEVIHLKDFLTVPQADGVSKLRRRCESCQDRTETDPHDLSSDFRLERRLCQRPQHPRRGSLAGGLGATRASLSR